MNLKHLSGQTAEAMAALALVREGFDVCVPCFHQPAFDLISKWGRAIHAIQVKTGTVGPNAKTIQWRTRPYKGLYSEDDCSYFGLVLIPHNEIWWIPYNVLKGKRSVCTNIESDSWAEYRGNTNGLKKCD